LGASVHFDSKIAVVDFVFDKLHLLIVDDDLAYAHLLSRYIKQIYDNSKVDICETAQEAMQLCRANDYAVLLVDYHLGDTIGCDFIRDLQSNCEEIPPPAIILTADGGISAARDALKVDAYDFLPKETVTTESLARSTKNAITKHQLRKSIIQRTAELEAANRSLREQRR